MQAVQDGGRFDETSGEPDPWQTPLADLRVHEWARRWLAEQWQEWQPRTRASATDALARFTTIAVPFPSNTPMSKRRPYTLGTKIEPITGSRIWPPWTWPHSIRLTRFACPQ